MSNTIRLRQGPKEAAAYYKVYSGMIYSIGKHYNYLGICGDL